MPPRELTSNKHHCVICNITIGNNKRSIVLHEQGKQHMSKISATMTQRLSHLSTTTSALLKKPSTTQSNPANRFASSLGVYGAGTDGKESGVSHLNEKKDTQGDRESQHDQNNVQNGIKNQNNLNNQTIQNTPNPVPFLSFDSAPTSEVREGIEMWLKQIGEFKEGHSEQWEQYLGQCQEVGIDLPQYIINLKRYIDPTTVWGRDSGEDVDGDGRYDDDNGGDENVKKNSSGETTDATTTHTTTKNTIKNTLSSTQPPIPPSSQTGEVTNIWEDVDDTDVSGRNNVKKQRGNGYHNGQSGQNGPNGVPNRQNGQNMVQLPNAQATAPIDIATLLQQQATAALQSSNVDNEVDDVVLVGKKKRKVKVLEFDDI